MQSGANFLLGRKRYSYKSPAKIVESTKGVDLLSGLFAALPLSEFLSETHMHTLDADGQPRCTGEAFFLHSDSLFANKLLQHELMMETADGNTPVVEIPCFGSMPHMI